MNDVQLSELFSKRNRKGDLAFHVFYHRYNIIIYNYLVKRSGSHRDSEDMYQLVFEKYFSKVRSGFIPDNPKSYLFRMARNINIDYQLSKFYGNGDSQKLKYEYYDEIEDIDKYFIDDLRLNIDTQEMIELLKQAISDVDIKYAGPLKDRYFNGYTIDDLSEKYELSYEAIRKRLSRAKSKIKVMLKPYINEMSN
jgi:RNA polymerase sigma-70 factor (ECF subfamily)